MENLPLSLLIIGMRGTGKTRLAEHFTRNEKRLVILDTLAEEAYEHAGVIIYSVEKLLQQMQQPVFRIVYRPGELQSEEPLKWVLKGALAVCDTTIIIEEIAFYASASRITPELEKAIRLGRHRRVKLIATSQRPADIHKLFVSQADIFLGKIFETNDARYLRGFSGVTKETIEKAAALPPVKKVKTDSGFGLEISYIATLDNAQERVISSL